MIVETLLAHWRPGGGEGYSGGGGHGGDSGGGGGGGAAVIIELIFRLIQLCIYYPQIGIPIVILIVIFLAYSAYQKNKTKDWDSGPPVELEKAVPLEPLRANDPDFSSILFEDFFFRLYASALETRHDPTALAGLGPYVSEAARTQLATREPKGPIRGVVIGAMRPYYVTVPTPADGPDARAVIGIELETNYTVATATGDKTYYAIERWRLTRAASARTRKIDPSKGFPCPNCGAIWPAAATATQRCPYCNEAVDNGRFAWQVIDVLVVHEKQQPPTLTEEVPERGTDLPTYRAHDADARWSQLCADDPALNADALKNRLGMIYVQLYAAWDKNDLAPVRPFLSDGLYDYLTYWTSAYKRQGLRNRLEKMSITRTELAKVTRDRWYDAVTIRIWGTGLDYVVKTKSGEHVRGSTHKPRPYSEYWTMIRSAARRGPVTTTPVCPSCGAEAKVGMGGACEFCGVHVTSGEFDWVLSKIEQDDSYRG